MLEQSYFLKEFEKLAKKLKVKYLQDYAEKQQAMDLHNTILISETRFQIQQNTKLKKHR